MRCKRHIALYILLLVKIFFIVPPAHASLFEAAADEIKMQLSNDQSDVKTKIEHAVNWYKKKVAVLENDFSLVNAEALLKTQDLPLNGMAFATLASILNHSLEESNCASTSFNELVALCKERASQAGISDISRYQVADTSEEGETNKAKVIFHMPSLEGCPIYKYCSPIFDEKAIIIIFDRFNELCRANQIRCQVEMYDELSNSRIKVTPSELINTFINAFGNTIFTEPLIIPAIIWCVENYKESEKKLVLPNLYKTNTLLATYPSNRQKKLERCAQMALELSYDGQKFSDNSLMTHDEWMENYLSESKYNMSINSLFLPSIDLEVDILSENSKTIISSDNYFQIKENTLPENTELYVVQLNSTYGDFFSSKELTEMSDACSYFFEAQNRTSNRRASSVYGCIGDFSILRQPPKISLQCSINGIALTFTFHHKGRCITKDFPNHSSWRLEVPLEELQQEEP